MLNFVLEAKFLLIQGVMIDDYNYHNAPKYKVNIKKLLQMYQNQVKVIAIYLYNYVHERDGVLSFL